MAARKAGQKVFDWTKLASNLSEEQRSVVTGLRSAYEAQKARCSIQMRLLCCMHVDAQTVDLCSCVYRTNAYPETPTPVKWDLYKTNIQKPEFVENLKKQVKWTFCLICV